MEDSRYLENEESKIDEFIEISICIQRCASAATFLNITLIYCAPVCGN